MSGIHDSGVLFLIHSPHVLPSRLPRPEGMGAWPEGSFGAHRISEAQPLIPGLLPGEEGGFQGTVFHQCDFARINGTSSSRSAFNRVISKDHIGFLHGA
ncbi:hypothetical protein PG999_004151 [Apiospora kogelbergensis]|uniref:Uncharacterized protein n=1 Tax=Apiospora kogelbergensis TaxID=1337665 RepID=A0AAW0R5G1_9PEZI